MHFISDRIKSYLLGLIIVSPLLTNSCSNHRTLSMFRDIDSFIQERPDSALSILEAINLESVNTSKLRAKYSLLYSIALDKNYIDTTDLSIIQPAVSFYARHGTPLEKMKTYFYRGCIHANRGEDDLAMRNYLLALEDSAKISDCHYKELVNSAISDIFSRNNNPEQELIYTKDALRYGRLANDSVGVWAITGHLASCYANCRRWDEAERTYNDYFAMSVYDSLSLLSRRLIYAKDLLRFPNSNPLKTIKIIEDIGRTHPYSMTIEGYCIYAYAYQKLGNCSLANTIIQQLEDLGQQEDIIRLWRYRISREQRQYKQALEDLEESVLVQDSIVLSTLRQPLIQSQRDYLQQETAILKKEKILNRQQMALVIMCTILLLGIIVTIYLRKKAALHLRIEELAALHIESQLMLKCQNAKAADYYAKLEEKDKALLQLRKQYARLYKSQFKALNDLCAAYFSPIKKDRKEVLYDEAMQQMEIIINDTTSQNKFMSMVNDSLDNIIDKLRQDLSGHKEQDFRFLMYVIVGFDATTISNLTGYSVGTVYTKKNRLRSEILSLSSEYRDFYLEYMS